MLFWHLAHLFENNGRQENNGLRADQYAQLAVLRETLQLIVDECKHKVVAYKVMLSSAVTVDLMLFFWHQRPEVYTKPQWLQT